jgi:HK97 family phage major capsid protein
MSDAAGRPIMVPSLQNPLVFNLLGSPLRIATQMPDVAPGATPIAYGNWKSAYMVANRKAITMQHDPYSAGFCHLYKFEARVGGAIICPNAARLLRIK